MAHWPCCVLNILGARLIAVGGRRPRVEEDLKQNLAHEEAGDVAPIAFIRCLQVAEPSRLAGAEIYLHLREPAAKLLLDAVLPNERDWSRCAAIPDIIPHNCRRQDRWLPDVAEPQVEGKGAEVANPIYVRQAFEVIGGACFRDRISTERIWSL